MNLETKNRKPYARFAQPLAERPPDREQGAWICYQLKRCGLTQRDIAGQVGVRPQMVQRVSYGLTTSARAQRALAEALGYDGWNDLLAARKGAAA